MIPYLRSWWFGETTAAAIAATEDESKDATSALSPSSPSTPKPSGSPPEAPLEVPPVVSVTILTPEETQVAIGDSHDGVVHTDAEDDTPPAFPSLNSIQRSATPLQQVELSTKSNAELMPPPPLPRKIGSLPGTNSSSSRVLSQPIGTTTSSLLPPASPDATRIPSASRKSSNTLKLPPSTTRAPPAPSKRREKVALAPGHSPLDWAALKASGQNLRGTSGLTRITPSQLKAHNKRDDAWAAFNGRVYNITPYLSFHPGGEKELMRVAGRDGTKLFALTHAWVNVEFMLDECLVGFLVPEPSSAA